MRKVGNRYRGGDTGKMTYIHTILKDMKLYIVRRLVEEKIIFIRKKNKNI